jgi:hypothetical protein
MPSDSDIEAALEADEASWIYVSGPRGVTAADDLYDLLTAACVETGWHVYRPSQQAEPSGLTGDLFERVQHAVGHAEAFVAHIGTESPSLGAELALARARRRPIVGVLLAGDSPPDLICSLVADYERGRIVECETAQECREGVRQVLMDPGFADVVRAAVAEDFDDA